MATAVSVAPETWAEGAHSEYAGVVLEPEDACEHALEDTQDEITEELEPNRLQLRIILPLLTKIIEEVLERVENAGKEEEITEGVLDRVKQDMIKDGAAEGIMEGGTLDEIIVKVLEREKQAGELEATRENFLEFLHRTEDTRGLKVIEVVLERVEGAREEGEITEEVLVRVKQEMLEELHKEIIKASILNITERVLDPEHGKLEDITDQILEPVGKEITETGKLEKVTEQVLEWVKEDKIEQVTQVALREFREDRTDAAEHEEILEEVLKRVRSITVWFVQVVIEVEAGEHWVKRTDKLEEITEEILELVLEEMPEEVLQGVKQAGKQEQMKNKIQKRVKRRVDARIQNFMKLVRDQVQHAGKLEEITEVVLERVRKLTRAPQEKITEVPERIRRERIEAPQLEEIRGEDATVPATATAPDGYAKKDIEAGGPHMDPEIYRCATTSGANGIPPSEVEMLTEIGSDKVRSPLGNTVLHLAGSAGHLELVKLILGKFGGLLKQDNYNGDLPLHLAASAGHLSVVRFFLDDKEHTSILTVQNKRGNTALHMALENHHPEVAEFLASKDYDGSVSHLQNGYKETPLCMAAEAGNLQLVKQMVSRSTTVLNGNSVLRAAIRGRNTDVLETILSKVDPALINFTDEEWMTPLTLASYIGNLEAVRCLLKKSNDVAHEMDHNNFIPIHAASKNGHIEVVEEFLKRCPESRELLDSRKWNILHVAAAYGRSKMVIYMLKKPELEMLINERDETGNTPLHIAVKNWHPKIVRILTTDKRVNFNILNNAGMTALDVADESKIDKEVMFRRKLTFMALKLADAPRCEETRRGKSKLVMEDSDMATSDGSNLTKTKDSSEDLLFASRENVKTLVLVSTLVATITFAAGFAMPGGYNNSGTNGDGLATLVSKWPFQIFLICNTIATYCSISATLALILAQMGDLNMIYAAMRFVLPILSLALTMMSIAFLAVVALVAKNRIWLSSVVVGIGSIIIIIILLLVVPLAAPISSKNFVARFILLANFTLLMSLTTYDIELDQRQTQDSKMDLNQGQPKAKTE